MKKVLSTVAVLVVVCGVILAYSSAATAQHASAQVQELEDENAELKEKLDNIQGLVAEAKSHLDDVEGEVQSDEPCEDTNAQSYASDVEDKLNEIESEASY
jgi:peptidoglycan hydrolase CwlO-like protein